MMAMSEIWTLELEGSMVPVTVTFKRIRNINFRLSRDGTSLSVSAPYGTPKLYLKKKIEQFYPRLHRRTVYERPINGDDVYLFGVKTNITGFADLDETKQKKFLKTQLLSYIKEKEPAYEKAMGVGKPYDLRVRAMRSRYGVNSLKTHRLTFALELVHYLPSVIDSVIVHELAHDKERNHGPRFYKIVYSFCPDYRTLYAKLRKHHYGN